MGDIISNRLVIGAVAALFGFTCAHGAAEPTRISLAKFSKEQKLADALSAGFASMHQGSSADPQSDAYHTSLAYWANTHGYFGTGKHAHSMGQLNSARQQCTGRYGQETCDSYYLHVHLHCLNNSC